MDDGLEMVFSLGQVLIYTPDKPDISLVIEVETFKVPVDIGSTCVTAFINCVIQVPVYK